MLTRLARIVTAGTIFLCKLIIGGKKLSLQRKKWKHPYVICYFIYDLWKSALWANSYYQANTEFTDFSDCFDKSKIWSFFKLEISKSWPMLLYQTSTCSLRKGWLHILKPMWCILLRSDYRMLWMVSMSQDEWQRKHTIFSDPRGRPSLQNLAKITAGLDCWLAEWIIDNSCLVAIYCIAFDIFKKLPFVKFMSYL